MADYGSSQANNADRIRAGGVLGIMLDVCGWVMILLAVIAGIAGVWEVIQRDSGLSLDLISAQQGNAAALTDDQLDALERQHGRERLADVISALALTMGGVVAGMFLFGVAELIQRMELLQTLRSQTMMEAEDSRLSMRRAVASLDRWSDSARETTELLREVRDISLLTPEQRAQRLDAQAHSTVAVLQREVPVLLREHNWIEARNRVQAARERFPANRDWDHLEQQIEQMRAQVEQHDFENAERQINDLVSLAAWDRVDEVIKELLQRHPESERAHELAQRMRASRNEAESQQRTRLMSQAQEAVNRRDWQVALTAATTLIQRYPRSPEAQALRMQLPTLRENAQIKERQALEARYLESVKAQRFPEAVSIAREILEQYPGSPQAEKLREQLPLLEQRAHASR